MTRPHEALGLPQPVGRRLPQGLPVWNAAVAVVSVVLMILYVVEVNGAAAKSYALRDVERRVDTLRTQATILQNEYVAQTSLRSISARAQQLGLVPVEQIEYLHQNGASYAMAR